MGTKNRPGSFDCYASAEGDEPVFVLLARDVHAPLLVRMWADIREASGEVPVKIEEARSCADAMARWNERSRGRKPMLPIDVFALFQKGQLADELGVGALADGALPGDFEWNETFTHQDTELPSSDVKPETLKEKPAATAPIIDTVGEVKSERPKPIERTPTTKPKGAVLGNVMKVPADMPESAKTPDTPVAIAPPPAPPGRPAVILARTVTFKYSVTIGLESEFVLRYAPEFNFRATKASTNAPGIGFVTLTELHMGNEYVLYDMKRGEFTKPDAYEYCAKGAGHTGISSPFITPNHAIRLSGRYNGTVPDGFSYGEAFEFTFTLHGESSDARVA